MARSSIHPRAQSLLNLSGDIVAGLEQELYGMTVGQSKDVTVSAIEHGHVHGSEEMEFEEDLSDDPDENEDEG